MLSKLRDARAIYQDGVQSSTHDATDAHVILKTMTENMASHMRIIAVIIHFLSKPAA